MTAKLNYKGVEISVPTSELAEALRQIQALMLSQDSANQPQLFSGPQKPTPFKKVTYPEHRSALAFLSFIFDHRNTGTTTEQVQKILDAKDIKGVGSKTGAVNRLLMKYGFNPEDVYANSKDTAGERRWTGGPRLEDAIALVRKVVDGA